MSQKLPRVTAAELSRALGRDGWQAVWQSSSHVTLKHASKPGYVTLPSHTGVTIKPKTLAAILKQAGLTADELRQLL